MKDVTNVHFQMDTAQLAYVKSRFGHRGLGKYVKTLIERDQIEETKMNRILELVEQIELKLDYLLPKEEETNGEIV